MYAMTNKPTAEQTASPDKYPQGYFKPKPCRKCGDHFKPNAPSHLYCGDVCAKWALSNKYLLRTYGITRSQYDQMLEDQNHRCKICEGEGFIMTVGGMNKLVVDHCHITGSVRGLLCHNCNRALGLLQDNTINLKAAIVYLEGATTIP